MDPTNTFEVEQLKEELKDARGERDKYHNALVDLRLVNIELAIVDFKLRLRPLEDGLIKSNTIYTLFAGNGILSIIVLIKLFLG